MNQNYVAPEFGEEAFHCPHCNVYAHHNWLEIDAFFYEGGIQSDLAKQFYHLNLSYQPARCSHCNNDSLWLTDTNKMIYPLVSTAPMPNEDLPDDIKEDFNEARAIAQLSPRGAAALLRLCLQKLCEHFGKKSMRIDKAIEELVKEGISLEVQQALDIVRLVGNNAVHPGAIDLKENIETVNYLFDFINLIAQEMITNPKNRKAFLESLPQKHQSIIEKRSKKIISENK